MDKSTPMDGTVFQALGGAVATILLDREAGSAAPDPLKGHLEEIRDRIVQRLEGTQNLTKRKYEGMVRAIIAEYQAATKVSKQEAGAVESRLCDGYDTVKAAFSRPAGDGEHGARPSVRRPD